jgi:hypothetical protein
MRQRTVSTSVKIGSSSDALFRAENLIPYDRIRRRVSYVAMEVDKEVTYGKRHR